MGLAASVTTIRSSPKTTTANAVLSDNALRGTGGRGESDGIHASKDKKTKVRSQSEEQFIVSLKRKERAGRTAEACGVL